VRHPYRNFILILALAICLPLASFAIGGNPTTDCPKKNKSQEDSVDIYKSENKVLEDTQVQNFNAKPALTRKAQDKVTYKTFEGNLDESDEVADEDPNSAMSFNFIYYIIDKFKFTDPLQ